MDEESVTDTESESESEYDLERNSGSDSLSDSDGGKPRKKRKMEKKRQLKSGSQYLRETIKNKSELPVTCGDKRGTLYVEKYNDMQECILSEGQWFMPRGFEKFGGKERNKKWKTSILCKGFPLEKLIEEGYLSSFRKQVVHNGQDNSPESSSTTNRLRKRKDERLSSNKRGSVQNEQDTSPESSPIARRVNKRRSSQDRKVAFPLNSESVERDDDDNDDDDNDNNDDDDDIDMTMFEGPTLPVTSGLDSGVLHKHRFATGHSGKCIRTKNFWLTPNDFIRLTKPDGIWRRDILCHGIPLGKLIMKRVLEMHMINCSCDICQDLDQYLNDDECFVCDSVGRLVCCDDCPRSFHSECHLPALDEDSLGEHWSCTFCVMKTKGSTQKTQQDVLSSPVSQFTLHCQCLLLHLLHESKTDPCANVAGNSENITGRMLNGVKQNLERNRYRTVQEFVSDIKDKFHGGDNQSRSKLEDVFNREFETIFKLV